MTCECFLHHWTLVKGIHQLPVDSPHKGSVIRSFDIFFVVSLNSPLNKLLSQKCSQTLTWRHCNVMATRRRYNAVYIRRSGIWEVKFQSVWNDLLNRNMPNVEPAIVLPINYSLLLTLFSSMMFSHSRHGVFLKQKSPQNQEMILI